MNKKRLTTTIILLFLLFASAFGNYANSGNDYYADRALIFGFLDFCISCACMMFIPFICRLSEKKKIEYEEGRKICKWNSIILFIVSVLLKMTQISGGFIGGLGALFFYFINKWLFVKDKEVKDDNGETERKENAAETPREETTEKSVSADTEKEESVK